MALFGTSMLLLYQKYPLACCYKKCGLYLRRAVVSDLSVYLFHIVFIKYHVSSLIGLLKVVKMLVTVIGFDFKIKDGY